MTKDLVDASRGRNKFRPPTQLSDIARNVRTNYMSYGNTPPKNEKELFRRSADPYRGHQRVTGYNPSCSL